LCLTDKYISKCRAGDRRGTEGLQGAWKM